MPACPHCNKNYSSHPLKYKCDTCASTWCANGNCKGSSGKPQRSRSPNAICQSCGKRSVNKIK